MPVQARPVWPDHGVSGGRGTFTPIVPKARGFSSNIGWVLICAVVLLSGHAAAQSSDPADQVCPRLPAGSNVTAPADLYSQSGVLEVNLKFLTAVDTQGLTRYCYITDGGLQAPTLHVNPGDQLIIHLQNGLPAATSVPAMAAM